MIYSNFDKFQTTLVEQRKYYWSCSREDLHIFICSALSLTPCTAKNRCCRFEQTNPPSNIHGPNKLMAANTIYEKKNRLVPAIVQNMAMYG
jgi:hypothetical protein